MKIMKTIKLGDIVQFGEAMDPWDESERFIVIEDCGDRLLVRSIDPHWQKIAIIPSGVYLRSELKIAK